MAKVLALIQLAIGSVLLINLPFEYAFLNSYYITSIISMFSTGVIMHAITALIDG